MAPARTNYAVIIVDEDEQSASQVTGLLEERGFRVECATSAADARQRLERSHFDALVVRRASACDAPPACDAGGDDGAIVAVSAAFRETLALADRVAATPSTSVLLVGESGTGKEVLAARIHRASQRRSGPLVRVNLAAIPESVVEAELFGSLRGAFTDSKRDRAGYFGSAEGGTLLLDELGEFRIDLQAKLLRVLESRRYFPIGSDRERAADVRVLAATNRDPADLLARGLLREDLYYRLATVIIRVPPLRERPEDILPLAEHFLAHYARELGRPRLELSAGARRAALDHTWPGNVRELRNAIERAVIVSDTSTIDAATLGLAAAERPARWDAPIAKRTAARRSPPMSPSEILAAHAVPAATPANGQLPAVTRLRDVEREHIVRVLASLGGSRTRAAQLLGLSRSTLNEKLKKYGLG